MRARPIRAAITLVLGVAFCFVMYAWQLRYDGTQRTVWP